MGGMGSGSWYRYSSKRTTTDMWALDIRRLHKEKLLKPGMGLTWQWTRNDEPASTICIHVHEHHVTLKYRTRPRGGEWEDKEYPVGLEWTACHYGGHRPWFLCPCCRRRVAILFGGSIYACRHCHNLAYDSQREMVHTRLQSRAHKLRARLGGDCWWRKPKGMHQRTYKKLLAEYQHYEEAADVAFYGRAKKILGL